jgi:hypothetical protein
MVPSFTDEKGQTPRTASPPSETGVGAKTDQPDGHETARDTGIMMDMIIGSISPDPDEIQRGLDKRQARLASPSDNNVSLGLVVLTVVLVFLVFALDLVFLAI